MAGPTFADGDVPTGADFNDYLGAKGLLRTKKITAGDTVFTALSSEQLIDTMDNVTVGAGCSLARAIEIRWQLMATNSANLQTTYTAKAYYKAGASFGSVSGATQFFNSPFAFDLENFKDDIMSMSFFTSLTQATVYSFGLTLTKTADSGSTTSTTVRGSATFPRLVAVLDVGQGTRIA
jgi:hypothetical protein